MNAKVPLPVRENWACDSPMITEQEGTLEVQVAEWSQGLSFSAAGRGVVSHAGAALPRLVGDRTGLTSQLSKALARTGFIPVHDRVRVLPTSPSCWPTAEARSVTSRRCVISKGVTQAEVRYATEPWSGVAAGGDGFCGLALWTEGAAPPAGVRLLSSHPVDVLKVVAVANDVAFQSEVKGDAVKAILRRFKRMNEASSLRVVRFTGSVEIVQELERRQSVAYLRAIPRPSGALQVTAFVAKGDIQNVIDEVSDAGGTGVVCTAASQIDIGTRPAHLIILI
jgi:hypothetical protein